MPVLERGHTISLWILAIVVTSLQLLGVTARITTTTTKLPYQPAPSLTMESRSRDHVTLVCRAPRTHQGVLFTLFRVTEEVQTFVSPGGSLEAVFRLNATHLAPAPQLYCCLYKNSLGVYSSFSPYLSLTPPAPAPAPTSPPADPLPPVLTLEPPGGRVRRGQTVSFSCSVPVTRPMPGTPTFVLVKKGLGKSVYSSIGLRPQTTSTFSVGPVKGGEGGSYACMYQVPMRTRLLNSTLSNAVQVTVTDLPPRPTLALQQQEGVWHLFCTGTAAYPGALFSLYRADDLRTVATHQVSGTAHQTAFPIPVLDQASVQFECSYSALLGTLWSESERSLPLEVDQGLLPSPAKASLIIDWPLVAGSFSAVVLFMAALVLMVLVVRRKVRGDAVEKKKREEAEFWTKSQGKDHMADLDPRHSTFDHECASGTAETAPRSSVWNPLSTFTSPSLH